MNLSSHRTPGLYIFFIFQILIVFRHPQTLERRPRAFTIYQGKHDADFDDYSFSLSTLNELTVADSLEK